VARLPRIYFPSAGPGLHRLEGEVARRLANVLRLREDDPLLLFAGDGREWLARIRRVEARAVLAEVVELARLGAPPRLLLDVRCALVRPQRFDWAVEKVTEAGADVIGALVTERTTERSTDGARRARWERIAAEAAEQSGRLWVPAIAPTSRLEEALQAAAGPILVGDARGMAFGEAARRIPESGRLTVLVGPEGGFSERELAAAEACGALLASFGPHTLRSETAAVVATALIRTRWE
jgi:16S rRNA (uracil1498-N3)-methyltransferase